jgi:hypothetical protein
MHYDTDEIRGSPDILDDPHSFIIDPLHIKWYYEARSATGHDNKKE